MNIYPQVEDLLHYQMACRPSLCDGDVTGLRGNSDITNDVMNINRCQPRDVTSMRDRESDVTHHDVTHHDVTYDDVTQDQNSVIQTTRSWSRGDDTESTLICRVQDARNSTADDREGSVEETTTSTDKEQSESQNKTREIPEEAERLNTDQVDVKEMNDKTEEPLASLKDNSDCFERLAQSCSEMEPKSISCDLNGLDVWDLSVSAEKLGSKKLFVCALCRRVFPDENSLEEHFTTESNGQCFSPTNALTVHVVHKVVPNHSSPNGARRSRSRELGQFSAKRSQRAKALAKRPIKDKPQRPRRSGRKTAVNSNVDLREEAKTEHKEEKGEQIETKVEDIGSEPEVLDNEKAAEDFPENDEEMNDDSEETTQVLVTGMTTFHQEEPKTENFHCDMCGRTFKSQKGLNNHRRCHKNQITVVTVADDDNKETLTFECAECGKGFATKSDLAVHNHNSEPEQAPFQCAECEKPFTTKRMLLNHSAIHIQERPHQCELCGKAFKRKYYLLEHNRTHSGEKAFQCDECGRSFSWKWNLKEHRRRIHR